VLTAGAAFTVSAYVAVANPPAFVAVTVYVTAEAAAEGLLSP